MAAGLSLSLLTATAAHAASPAGANRPAAAAAAARTVIGELDRVQAAGAAKRLRFTPRKTGRYAVTVEAVDLVGNTAPSAGTVTARGRSTALP